MRRIFSRLPQLPIEHHLRLPLVSRKSQPQRVSSRLGQPAGYPRYMDEQPVLDHIEELIAEEHTLWRAESEGSLDEAGHERLAVVRHELDRAYETLRRRRAGQPDQGPTDGEVPDPPNELDGPDAEPVHTDHGVHDPDSSGSDPSPNAP